MRKKIEDALKAQIALEAIRGEKTAAEIASKYGVHVNVVAKYKAFAVSNMATLFSHKDDERVKELEETRDELHRQIGEQKVAIDWLKKSVHSTG
jgi:putative transposase